MAAFDPALYDDGRNSLFRLFYFLVNPTDIAHDAHSILITVSYWIGGQHRIVSQVAVIAGNTQILYKSNWSAGEDYERTLSRLLSSTLFSMAHFESSIASNLCLHRFTEAKLIWQNQYVCFVHRDRYLPWPGLVFSATFYVNTRLIQYNRHYITTYSEIFESKSFCRIRWRLEIRIAPKRFYIWTENRL